MSTPAREVEGDDGDDEDTMGLGMFDLGGGRRKEVGGEGREWRSEITLCNPSNALEKPSDENESCRGSEWNDNGSASNATPTDILD